MPKYREDTHTLPLFKSIQAHSSLKFRRVARFNYIFVTRGRYLNRSRLYWKIKIIRLQCFIEYISFQMSILWFVLLEFFNVSLFLVIFTIFLCTSYVFLQFIFPVFLFFFIIIVPYLFLSYYFISYKGNYGKKCEFKRNWSLSPNFSTKKSTYTIRVLITAGLTIRLTFECSSLIIVDN